MDINPQPYRVPHQPRPSLTPAEKLIAALDDELTLRQAASRFQLSHKTIQRYAYRGCKSRTTGETVKLDTWKSIRGGTVTNAEAIDKFRRAIR